MRTSRDGSAAPGTRSWLLAVLVIVTGCGPAEPAKQVDRRDAGWDAGHDAGVDAGTDAGVDAGVDAGPVVVRRTGRFFEHPDRPIRQALADQPIESVERGFGGRSLGFRITLADGTRAYFKPAQSFSGMSWQAEIAAFHLDRELGLGRTAPSIGRRVALDALLEAAGDDPRVEELQPEDGHIDGALIWWVPDRLHALPLPDGFERWLRIDDALPPITPYQRANLYREQAAALTEDTPPREVPEPPDPDREDRPSELSDLIVFDYLIHNGDRWSSNRSNLRIVGEGGPLMFLDNAAGFTMRRPRTPLMDARLTGVQRFRRATIAAIRRLSLRRFERRLDRDPRAPLLDPEQLEHFAARREALLEHVDGLIAQFGEDEVLCL